MFGMVILLAGITARMLADLALAAGYQVVALDYFGDADLQARCTNVSLRHDYQAAYTPAALVDAAGDLQADAVVYGASLENHEDQVSRLAHQRCLLGNTPSTLRRVREPGQLAQAVQAAGFAFPRTLSMPTTPTEAQHGWLWKPLRSGGGHGVKVWRGGALPDQGVLQERVPGVVCSAAFVANGHQAVVLGLTEQLVGQRAFGASGFRYCGNLVLPRLPSADLHAMLAQVRVLVSHLTATFDLRGLNGLDFVWHAGRIWTLEINPRPTAALELLDHVYGMRVFDLHVRAFDGMLPAFDLEQVMWSQPAAGKAVWFAPHDLVVGDTRDWRERGLRDIPHSGEQIERGHPVCTILATGDTPDDCLRQLRDQGAILQTTLTTMPGAR